MQETLFQDQPQQESAVLEQMLPEVRLSRSPPPLPSSWGNDSNIPFDLMPRESTTMAH